MSGIRRFVTFGLLLAIPASAQQPAGIRAAAELLAAMPQLAATSPAGALTEVTVRWTLGGAAPGAAAVPGDVLPQGSAFTVAGTRAAAGPMVFERDPQLSEDQLVVVAVDAAGNEVGWQLVKDPRVLRGEAPGADGVLSGVTLYRPVSEFVLTAPATAAVAAFHVYQPQWSGTAFLLTPLGTVTLGPA